MSLPTLACFAFLLVSLATGDDTAALIGDRIFNGEDAAASQFPYQVWLVSKLKGLATGYILCGGSLISDTHVVSAAHCFHGIRIKYTRLYFGLWSMDTGFTYTSYVKRKDITVHPKYNSKNFQNDISVITLTEPVPLAQYPEYIAKIELPKVVNAQRIEGRNPSFYNGMNVTASGWGRTNNSVNSVPPENLQYQFMNVMNHGACTKFFKKNNIKITKKQVCTDKTAVPASGPCQGDSGGPLAYTSTESGTPETRLVGITSFIFGNRTGRSDVACVNDNPAVYTNVARFMPWIDKVTKLGLFD